MIAVPRDEKYATAAMREVARGLARAFLAGETSVFELRARGARALGRKWPWLNRLVREILFDCGEPLRPTQHDEVVRGILKFDAFRAAFENDGTVPVIRAHFPFHSTMGRPPRALAHVALPALATPGDLAAWLELTPGELDWFADIAGWGSTCRDEALRHYRYQWRPKSNGGVRLLEAPKPRLRAIQRRILREILDRVPTHDAAHGCVRGRSALSNAGAHAGQPWVLRLDLTDFFASIRGARVNTMFRTLGYPPATARYLTGLTTHGAPAAIVKAMPIDEYASLETRRELAAWARRFRQRHLPQGAPTSAALANLCAYRLDLRLAGAAHCLDGEYTRYVDDLFFSGGIASLAHARRIALMAYTIIIEEDFAPNVRKTRAMPRTRAQHVTGLVVNDRPNVPRAEFDRLKAILTNCTRHGPSSQNRESRADFRAHLLGRLAYLEQVNPVRGARLRVLFDRILWA